MGERKVLNKYFPPDFDPALIPKRRGPKNNQIKVRVMLPFTCQCKSCGEFIHRGKKFNSRCEWADERYLGIRIMRFYIKCTNCVQEITFKTDPQNSDYVCEHGAVRNFEPWREDDHRLTFMKELNEEALKGDVMKTLESRTEESKKEMDILDGLEEIKELNAKNAQLKTEEVIALKGKRLQERIQKEEDDELAQVKFGLIQDIKRLENKEAAEAAASSTLFGPEKPKGKKSKKPKDVAAPPPGNPTPSPSAPSSTSSTNSVWSALAEEPKENNEPSCGFVVIKKKEKKKKRKDREKEGDGNGKKKPKKDNGSDGKTPKIMGEIKPDPQGSYED